MPYEHIAYELQDGGDDTVVAPILERLGYHLERAKTNVGLGRRGAPPPVKAPEAEMVNS